MSLNFDFSKCDIDKDKLWIHYTDDFGQEVTDTAPIPKSVVFMSMAIGMPNITEANAKEFWRRTDLYQRIYGTMLMQPDPNGGWMPLPLTRDDIFHYIGLHTNVNSITKQKFQMSLGKDF